MTSQWFKNRFFKSKSQGPDAGLPLIVALDGFLNAGNVSALSAKVLRQNPIRTVHEFDTDSLIDHRARRPMIKFSSDRYHEYRPHRLAVTQHVDAAGAGYFLLSGPEPDFGWEHFSQEVHDIIDEHRVSLVLNIGGVPMAVPHTRPSLITSHGNRPELVDRANLWDAEVRVPASAQSVLEVRLGEFGHDAAGYVVHVPHYLGQVDFPAAALELVETASLRLDLLFNVERLLLQEEVMNAQIQSQIEDQGGLELLHGLEQQYDAFHGSESDSLLADDQEIPTGEELAHQFEEFLARHTGEDKS